MHSPHLTFVSEWWTAAAYSYHLTRPLVGPGSRTTFTSHNVRSHCCMFLFFLRVSMDQERKSKNDSSWSARSPYTGECTTNLRWIRLAHLHSLGETIWRVFPHFWVLFASSLHWHRVYIGPIIHLSVIGKPMIVLSNREAISDLLEKKAIYSERPVVPMAGEL